MDPGGKIYTTDQFRCWKVENLDDERSDHRGLLRFFIFFPSTLKTTREESKMSNFHTTLFQNSFV